MRWTVGAAIGAAVLVLAAGCGTSANDAVTATPAPGASGQPGVPQGGQPVGTTNSTPITVNVAEALDTANKEFALLQKADWAGAWKLWTATAKKKVPKAIFVGTNAACPLPVKQTYALQDVKPVSNQLIELTYRRGDLVQHGALRADKKSGWFFDPGSELLADYTGGTKDAIHRRKVANQC